MFRHSHSETYAQRWVGAPPERGLKWKYKPGFISPHSMARLAVTTCTNINVLLTALHMSYEVDVKVRSHYHAVS